MEPKSVSPKLLPTGGLTHPEECSFPPHTSFDLQCPRPGQEEEGAPGLGPYEP